MTLAIPSGHRLVPQPRRLAGGASGQCGRNRIVRTDGRVDDLAAAGRTEIGAGEVWRLETPGGGHGKPGWGRRSRRRAGSDGRTALLVHPPQVEDDREQDQKDDDAYDGGHAGLPRCQPAEPCPRPPTAQMLV
jgi:hypothetical protein